MRSCTFFGHRDCPEAIRTKLQKVLIDLIINHNITMFYVGHQGQFDALVRSTLRQLKNTYPQIEYAVVLAYMPKDTSGDYTDTMLPGGD